MKVKINVVSPYEWNPYAPPIMPCAGSLRRGQRDKLGRELDSVDVEFQSRGRKSAKRHLLRRMIPAVKRWYHDLYLQIRVYKKGRLIHDVLIEDPDRVVETLRDLHLVK